MEHTKHIGVSRSLVYQQEKLGGAAMAEDDKWTSVARLARDKTAVAMVAAVWSVLHRAGTGMKLAAFALYGVGMALLGPMMLQQAHLREQAVAAMRGLPGERSAFAAAFLQTQQSGWFTLVWLFQHAAPWLLMAGVAWLLFAWKGRESR